MTETKSNLLSYSRAELEELMVSLGRKPFHGRQLHAWIHRKLVADFDRMTDLAKDLRDRLSERFSVELPALVETVGGDRPDSATKFLLEYGDGARVEVVRIPTEDRNTLCLSSQVGCAYQCEFCETGRLGLTRDLTATEIVASYLVAQQQIEARLSNLVFMGMGEPLANLGEVMRAWDVFTDPDGIGLSRRKVTLSTVGLPVRIRQLAQRDYPPKLVFSIGSPHEEVRRKLLPVAGKFSLRDNHAALMEYAHKTRNRITIALLVAAGRNDSLEDARALHRWISDLPAKVNLLRYNETFAGWKRPDEKNVEAFAEELVRLGRTVILRQSRGRDVAAACGQLAATQLRFS